MAILFNEDAENLDAKPIVGYRTGMTLVTEGLKTGVMIQFKKPDGTLTAYSFPAEMAIRMAHGLLSKASMAQAAAGMKHDQPGE